MKDHGRIAKERPEAYAGTVLMVGEREPRSIVAAANVLDLSPLVRRFRQWAITEDGLDCLSLSYSIPSDRLYETDWVDHMRRKTWIDIDDFKEAYAVAKQYFEISHRERNA